MADSDNSTNALYELIRKELNSIINENSAAPKPGNLSSRTNLETVGAADSHLQTGNESHKLTKSSDKILIKETTIKEADTKENLSTLLSTKILQSPRDENQSAAAIDADLQRMRSDLHQSYELFQTMGERFQVINFSSLKSRIKDLNLAKKVPSVKLEHEIKEMLQKHYRENTLDKLTAEMGEKFQQHPGEFGNIPELSEFFQTCTQLQHGLEQLKRQRISVNEMTKRLSGATAASYARIDKIHDILRSRQPSHDLNSKEQPKNL